MNEIVPVSVASPAASLHCSSVPPEKESHSTTLQQTRQQSGHCVFLLFSLEKNNSPYLQQTCSLVVESVPQSEPMFIS